MNKSELINKSLERLPEHKRNGFITAVNGLEPILLFDFFMWFRANGEKHTDVSIEKMIEVYLNETSNHNGSNNSNDCEQAKPPSGCI